VVSATSLPTATTRRDDDDADEVTLETNSLSFE
jgi:hypothetical protein